MHRHYKGIGIVLLVMAAAFVAALALGLEFVAYGVLIAGLVVLFLLSVAFMRPSGRTPEHHARVDKAIHDTNP